MIQGDAPRFRVSPCMEPGVAPGKTMSRESPPNGGVGNSGVGCEFNARHDGRGCRGSEQRGISSGRLRAHHTLIPYAPMSDTSDHT